MAETIQKGKKYAFALVTIYMCYFTHGIQALILSQNSVNFYTQWGFTDANAGAAAVSLAITFVGVGKLVGVWPCGELSDRIGRKPFVIVGSILYIVCFSILLVTDNVALACFAAFASGLATSVWDGGNYAAVQEAAPRYAASGVIGIKGAVSLMGIIYPIFAVANAAPQLWHINIYLPLGMSVLCLIMAIFTPFRFDDEKKTIVDDGGKATNEAAAELQAAKDAMLAKPGALVQFFTLFNAFLCMFVMYGGQQYTKAYGITNLGLTAMESATLTSVYTIGSVLAVFFWAFMMGKLRWNSLKVLLIDFIGSTVAIALVLTVPSVIVVYIAIALLGFCAAGGALQTGLVVRQMYCPAPKGRNTGMYMSCMGIAAVFLPFVVSAMTGAIGETSAMYIMMYLLLAASAIGTAANAYLAARSKALFGFGINKKLD